MSHFTVYECRVTNVEYVKKALVEMGFTFREDCTIKDYYNQNRDVKLAVVKNGKLLPVGFIQKDDHLELQADWFGTRLSEREFTNTVSQLHSKFQVLDTLEDNRWSVEDITVNEEGHIEVNAYQYV